jgi:P4 family phage/plasmid primase-like protien
MGSLHNLAALSLGTLSSIAVKHKDDPDDALDGIDLEKIAKNIPGGNIMNTRTVSAADLAEDYLATCGETLKCWRGSFYRWTGRHYEEVAVSDLTASVITFLQRVSRKSAGARAAAEVVSNVKAYALIRSNVEPPALLLHEGSAPAPRNLIPMANGVLDVGKYLAGTDPLTPHSSDLFVLHSLPYAYTPGAECPTFHEIMKRNLPDPEFRAFLQEWLGLNLIPDPTFEAFMLFTGEAGTGKTVTCTVLTTMLGPASVSAIPLEAFSPVRTFPLSALVGKLANIAEEIGECDKAAEGLLKQIVTGSPVTIERKYRDPFQLRNRARLTFATNVLPRFADRSNGIWRRMLVLPFAQVVPEHERDRRFLDPEWWIASGELPGVFLWALEGLRRLQTRGRFDEPVECQKIREDYKRDSNPAANWLQDNCKGEITATANSSAIYRTYAYDIKAQGHHPLSEAMFAREVRRLFPLAEKKENATFQEDGSRARLWLGLQFNGRHR